MSAVIGQPAPAFSGPSTAGDLSLADFKGKKLAVYFYPKDNTPGCTNQACSIRDTYASLKEGGIAIIGISTDTLKSHEGFIEKKSLPFPLIADRDHSIAEAFGSWGPKKFMGREFLGTLRKTFLIDENGILVDIIDKPNTKDHGTEIMERFAALT
jgi:thioredoxin-dependent peroxiredoxin